MLHQQSNSLESVNNFTTKAVISSLSPEWKFSPESATANMESNNNNKESGQESCFPDAGGIKKYNREFLLQLRHTRASLLMPPCLPDLPKELLKMPYSSKMFNLSCSDPFFKGLKDRSPVEKSRSDECKESNCLMDTFCNKTAERYKPLLSEIRCIQIDTESQLKAIIDLLFEKASNYPILGIPYAYLCRSLSLIRVPSATRQGETVNFNKLLNRRCQIELEKIKQEDEAINQTKQMIRNAESDEPRIIKLQKKLGELTSASKKRTLGNMKLIGEFFKLRILKENIIIQFVCSLISSRSEDRIECLCVLLKTVGLELDRNSNRQDKKKMEDCFTEMKKIVSQGTCPPRVKSMLNSIIRLRENKWVF